MKKSLGSKLALAIYDLVIFAFVTVVLFFLYNGNEGLSAKGEVYQTITALIIIFGARIIFGIYHQVWRYGGIQCYIRFMIADIIACGIYFVVERLLPIASEDHIVFTRLLAFCSINTIISLFIRMVYRYAYKCGNRDDKKAKLLRLLLKIFSGNTIITEPDSDSTKIKVAIVGAGAVGLALAENLRNNPNSRYIPRCFIDTDERKVGRTIHGISVVGEGEGVLERLKLHQVQEVILALPNLEAEKKKEIYEYYQKEGFQIKIYDAPEVGSGIKEGSVREIKIEDLLSRREVEVIDASTSEYYKDKRILITGGGGSIGGEICRQLAKMKAKQIVIVDIYENCAYDIQQSLKFLYKGDIDVRVEIVSITNKVGLARVYEEYRPQIVINAAAHKHVPLMEKNCIEAVTNNIFGTWNVIQLCEEYDVERFLMVSTDKAVNPTNVMGATKRVCEMIMKVYAQRGKVKCSATRFGNVLGSAGSVIPLFKNQIAAGGPITVTDKRIIRYFMTIPEASQLVLESGAIANNGDLFVLDMGKPVKIWDLAENMVKLSGVQGIEIIETGLRPGEKLYEELLVKSDNLKKTDNELIFIEQEEFIEEEDLRNKLAALKAACDSGKDSEVKRCLHEVVPTYKTPEEVNKNV